MAQGRGRKRKAKRASVTEASGVDDESEGRGFTDSVVDLITKLKGALVDFVRFLLQVCTRFLNNDRTNVERDHSGSFETDKVERDHSGSFEMDKVERDHSGSFEMAKVAVVRQAKGKEPIRDDDVVGVPKPQKSSTKKHVKALQSHHNDETDSEREDAGSVELKNAVMLKQANGQMDEKTELVIAMLKKALDKSDYARKDIRKAVKQSKTLKQSKPHFLDAFHILRLKLCEKIYTHFKDSGLTENQIYQALKANRMSYKATVAYLEKQLHMLVRSNLQSAEVPDERIDESLRNNKMNALMATAVLVKEQVEVLQNSLDQKQKENICKGLTESSVEKGQIPVEEKYKQKIYSVLNEAGMNFEEANNALTGFGKQKSTIKKKREVKVAVEVQIHESCNSRTRLSSVSEYMEMLKNGSEEREKPNTPSENRPQESKFRIIPLDTSGVVVYEDIEAYMVESYIRLKEIAHDNLMPIKRICCNEENQIKIGYCEAPRLSDLPHTNFVVNGRLETYAYRYLMSCVIDGASCLHSRDMYHGNIKLSSVFLEGQRYLLGCYRYNHEMELQELKEMMRNDIMMITSFIRSMLKDHGQENENHYEPEHLCEVLEELLLDKKLFSLMQIRCIIFGHPAMLPPDEIAEYIIGAYEFLARRGLLKLLRDENILSDRGWFYGIGAPYQDYLKKTKAVLSPRSGSDYVRTIYCCLNHRKQDEFHYRKEQQAGDPNGLLQHVPGSSPEEIVTFFRKKQPKMVVELYKVAYGQGFSYIPMPFRGT